MAFTRVPAYRRLGKSPAGGLVVGTTTATASWVALAAAVATAVAVTPATAHATWTVPAPTVATAVTQAAAPATSAWTVLNTARSTTVVVPASPATAGWTSPAASESTSVSQSAAQAVATWHPLSASVLAAVQRAAATATANWTALAAAANAGGSVATTPATAGWAALAAQRLAAVTVQATGAAATWTARSAAVTTAVLRTPSVAVAGWVAPPASVTTGPVTRAASPATAAWSVPAATRSAARIAPATPAIATAVANPAAVTAGGVVRSAVAALAAWTARVVGVVASAPNAGAVVASLQYAGARAAALAAIQRAGTVLTYTKIGLGTVDATTDQATRTADAASVRALILPAPREPNLANAPRTLQPQNARLLYFAGKTWPFTSDPAPTDTVTFEGMTWQVQGSTRIAPDGSTPVLYVVAVVGTGPTLVPTTVSAGYRGAQQLTAAAIQRAGTLVTYAHTTPGAVDATTDQATRTTTTASVRAAILPAPREPNLSNAQNTLIQQNQRLLYIPGKTWPFAADPQPTLDTVTFEGVTWTVQGATRIAPDGTAPVLYLVAVAR